MKKILIFYGKYGGGHLSAAKSIKEYIDKNYPETDTKLVDCMEYINKFVNKVSTSAYSEMAKKAPWAWRRLYRSSEHGLILRVSNISNRLMASKLVKCIDEYNPDLIISALPFSSHMCALLKKQGKIHCKIGTVMTDFHIHNEWLINSEYMDIYCVSNEQMKTDMCKKGIDGSKIFVTGIPFSERFLEKFNKTDILNEFHLSHNKKTALFFAGGEFGLGKSRTYEIFKTLITDFRNIQVIAIAGKNQKMKDLFLNCVKDAHREEEVCILDYTKKVPELMSISDFVITKPGGLTTTESLISGLPMLIINPIPGQEEQNAEFLENSGVGIWLKKDDDIRAILEKFLSSDENLLEMKQHALALAKPESLNAICNVMLENLA